MTDKEEITVKYHKHIEDEIPKGVWFTIEDVHKCMNELVSLYNKEAMDPIYRCKDCNRLMTVRTNIGRKRYAECLVCGQRMLITNQNIRYNGKQE